MMVQEDWSTSNIASSLRFRVLEDYIMNSEVGLVITSRDRMEYIRKTNWNLGKGQTRINLGR